MISRYRATYPVRRSPQTATAHASAVAAAATTRESRAERRRSIGGRDEISHKYLGRPYPNFRGGPDPRVIVTIAVDSIAHAPRD